MQKPEIYVVLRHNFENCAAVALRHIKIRVHSHVYSLYFSAVEIQSAELTGQVSGGAPVVIVFEQHSSCCNARHSMTHHNRTTEATSAT